MSDLKWRYVLCRNASDSEEWWNIRELYTDVDGGISWTANPVNPGGESIEEVLADLELMRRDCLLPYLDLTLNPPALVD